MKKGLLVVLTCVLHATLYGVYAPIPQTDLGQTLTMELDSSFRQDSNILGTNDNEVDGTVWTLSPRLKYNVSVTDQTFLTTFYDLEAQYFEDRGAGSTDDRLTNHTLGLSLSHTFSETAFLDISETYYNIENPESFRTGLAGLVAGQGDQSFTNNVLDIRLGVDVSEKMSTLIKWRNRDFSYDVIALSSLLDRVDNLIGLEVGYDVRPDTTLVFEYRYQDVAYDSDTLSGAVLIDKDSKSNFFMVGADWQPNPKMAIQGRFGVEDRDRITGSSGAEGFVQISALFRYLPQSYVSASFTYDVQESSNPISFTDENVVSLAFTVQHALTSKVYLSGMIEYTNSELQNRAATGQLVNVTDDVFRIGLGISWKPVERWMISLNYDLDSTSSDLAVRDENRSRFGLSARYTFGIY